MKTTRRGFLGALGLGAAAAALGAGTAEAAADMVQVPVPGGSISVAREPYHTLAARANEAVLRHAYGETITTRTDGVAMPTPSDPYEALQHGYEVATLRAESRRRLGLPLDRPSTDLEIHRAHLVEQGRARQREG